MTLSNWIGRQLGMEEGVEWAIEEDDDAIEDEEEESEPFTEDELAEARQYSLLIQWSPEDQVYMALSPEFPRLKTHGETQEEALAMGVESVAMWIYIARKDGEPVPEPSFFHIQPRSLSADNIR